MYNLKEATGTYKGLIGECLFKLTRRYAIITKFFNKKKYFSIFGDRLSEKEKEFIEKNWFSIDGIEFDYRFSPRKIVLFEVKTMNERYSSKPYWLPKITIAEKNMYEEAISLGFSVMVALVNLLDNWNYSVEIKNFEDVKFSIDKPKPYDKGVSH